MANIDYQVQGFGNICQRASLKFAVDPGTTIFEINNATSSMTGPLSAGMAFFLNQEVCQIIEILGSRFRVTRGCADTIPAFHVAESAMWFFAGSVGTDNREYLMGDQLGVKVLMKTTTKAMTIPESPPQALTMVGRFGRPYPPAQVFVGDGPFYSAVKRLDLASPDLLFQWAHRDRVTQGDQLIGHEQPSIGPEVGTTYTIKVFRPDGSLAGAVTGLTGTSYTYTLAQATAHFGGLSGPTPGYFELMSVRDGLESMQKYHIDFEASNSDGWGNLWGQSWGY